MPKGAEEQKVYIATRENTVASLGKLLEACSSTFNQEQLLNSTQEWFKLLPLVIDSAEAKPQHKMLMRLLDSNPDLIMNNNEENFVHCIKIFASVASGKCVDQETRNAMKVQFKKWVEQPQYKEKITQIELTDIQKVTLEKLSQ